MRIQCRRVHYCLLCITVTTLILLGYSSRFELPHQFPDTFNIARIMRSHAPNTPAPTSPPPISDLYFLKTHKTGGSTLQNILVRYAWNHELIVGLPRSDILFSSYYRGEKFSSKEIQPVPKGHGINMILHHMVFNHAEISSLLPEDAVYVTILRDPATLVRSAFNYFNKQVAAFRKASRDGFEVFINDPSRYFKGKDDGRFWWRAKNHMFFDLGYDNMNESESYIRQAIRTTEQIFDLVLITEYFDIGLLLLKDRMNWRIEDVAYAAMNGRKQACKKGQDLNTITKIYKWNNADIALYKYFNESFWGKVKQYGEDRMKRDLLKLESINTNYRKYCFEEEMILNAKVTDKSLKMFNPPGIDVMQYQLRNSIMRNESCISLIRPEFQWWKKLVTRQNNITKQTEDKTG